MFDFDAASVCFFVQDIRGDLRTKNVIIKRGNDTSKLVTDDETLSGDCFEVPRKHVIHA